MANNESTKKRIRQTVVRQERNRSYRSRMRNAIRSLRASAASGDADAARAALSPTLSLIDSTAKKGVIHRNTAARYKSRLTKLVAGVPVEAAAETATTATE